MKRIRACTGIACRVVGCLTRVKKGGKRFFRFPKDEARRKIWIEFTRKGANYKPVGSAGICEDHFTPDLFVPKKTGRVFLQKDAIPTIFYRETKQGIVKVEADFDPDSQQYVGYGNELIQRGTIQVEDEQSVQQKRYEKLKELKTLCRFCFFSKSEVKCVPLSKLESYQVDTTEMLSIIEIGPQYNEIFSEIICERCFQQLVSIDIYKKRCKKSQEMVIAEMEEFDLKLQNVSNIKAEERPWYNSYVSDDEIDDEQEIQTEIIEEHLDEAAYDDNFDNNSTDYQNESYEHYVIQSDDDKTQSRIHEIIIKSESVEELVSESEDAENDQQQINTSNILININARDEESDEGVEDPFPADRAPPKKAKDKIVYTPTSKDAIIADPVKSHHCSRVYECFICQLKFAGKKTFQSHQCQEQRVCEHEECPRKFDRVHLYNLHITKSHGLLKVAYKFCSLCKNVICMSEEEFKKHSRECSKKTEIEELQIECDICKQKCNSLKAFTIHRMFHDSRNLIASDSVDFRPQTEQEFKEELKKEKELGPAICEVCGKCFSSKHTLADHRRYVHSITINKRKKGPPPGTTFLCDLCGRTAPNRRILAKHIFNVHRNESLPCSICGRIFRTKDHLYKHMVYHDDSKRIHICDLCPNRPGYFNRTALKRHQISNHFREKNYVCEIGYCENSYTTNQQLKVHKRKKHDIAF